MPSSRSNRIKPADIASDTKRNFIPMIRDAYSDVFPPYSVLYAQPTEQLPIQRHNLSTRPPVFLVEAGDPVMKAIGYGLAEMMPDGPRSRVPFICAAHERRAGGDWETGVAGYEERLCRRSNLAATLSTPWPGSEEATNFPIPSTGGILSDSVVVYRGPHDRYEKLDRWFDLPVVSMPPTRWPKLKDNGFKYSFSAERDLIREKLRGALRICLYNGYDRVVIGDFGLGNGYRNPPKELAEMWRDVFLFDPDLRGQFSFVAFIFEDPTQSTMRSIHEDLARKDDKRGSSSKGRSRQDSHGGSSSSSKKSQTDLEIYSQVFNPAEIERVLSQPDPRYALNMITS